MSQMGQVIENGGSDLRKDTFPKFSIGASLGKPQVRGVIWGKGFVRGVFGARDAIRGPVTGDESQGVRDKGLTRRAYRVRIASMGRPKGSKNRATIEREQAEASGAIERRPDPGTKNWTLAQIDRQATITNKMFEDNGRKIDVVALMAHKAEMTRFPETPEALFESFDKLLAFCKEYHVAPTQGIFALWNGVTMQRVWQIENDKTDPRSPVVGICKETIRQFIEQSALEGTVNPILYFNQMKSQFSLPENQQVTIRVDDNSRELDEDEFNRRALQLIENDDGSYGPESV